jgi:predicted amidohydrolase YtcJ
MKLSNLLVLTLTLVSLSCQIEKKHEIADTIYFGGDIITMEDEQAEAVATKDGNILFVGSKKEVMKLKSSKTKLFNLNGKTLMPGFVEPHLHPWLAAVILPMEIIAPESWRLNGGKQTDAVLSHDNYIDKLTQLAKQYEDENKELLEVWGYNHSVHGVIRRADLDKISTTVPIALWHRSFHETIFNTKGLEYYGFTEENFTDAQSNWQEGHIWEGAHQVKFMISRYFKKKKPKVGKTDLK